MATLSNTYKKIAKSYLKKIAPKLKIQKALLFGSVARGEANLDSDIDLIILAEKFKNIPLIDRLSWLSRQRGEKFSRWPMDILGYTPEEFEQLAQVSSMFKEAKEQGIVIK